MLNTLKTWLKRAVVATRSRLATWFRLKKPIRGRWETGEHHEAAGLLTFAPFISPDRGYRLYIPQNDQVAERRPLLLMLHGCKQDAESFSTGTRINTVADRHGFLVLYPEQRLLANPGRCWNWFDPSCQNSAGEAAIIVGMLRAVIAQHHVDPSRIYVAGISAGGAMASALASCYADIFAACAVHSGLMFQAALTPADALPAMRHGAGQNPKQVAHRAFDISGRKVDAMPAMVIHGTGDTTVNPINATQIVAQFTELNQLCAKANHHHADVMQKHTTSHAIDGQYRYEIHDYGAVDRPLVRHVSVAGMGHAWSGGDARLPYNDAQGPDASAMMWAFFLLHRRDLASSTKAISSG